MDYASSPWPPLPPLFSYHNNTKKNTAGASYKEVLWMKTSTCRDGTEKPTKLDGNDTTWQHHNTAKSILPHHKCIWMLWGENRPNSFISSMRQDALSIYSEKTWRREFSCPLLTEFWWHILSGCQVCSWAIQYHLCSTYRGLLGIVVVQLSLLSGRTLAAQARGVLGLTPGGCQPFHFPLFSPHNINSFIHHNIFIPSLHLVPLCTPQNSLSYSYALNEQGTQHCNCTLHSLPHKMYLPCSTATN